MGYVYHGSKIHGLTELIPHESTHGTYLYATEDKNIATIMSQRCGDNQVYSFHIVEGKYVLIERIPHAFDKMFDTSCSIYTLDDSTFKNMHTGFNEVLSEERVKVLKEERIDYLMDKINEMVNEGLIEMYRYPNRPEFVPEDDHDLIDMMYDRINKYNKQFSYRDLARVIFLHPDLEEDVRKLAKLQNIELGTYDEIKDMFIEIQEKNPETERYISNAEEMYEYKMNKKLL